MRTDRDGRGVVNVLAADKLMRAPRLYATFLLWLLSELFEELPEVGDPDKPKLVFFFDEAHLLFDDAPEGADRQGRAGGAADPLQGRRRLFRHAEPARHSRDGAGPARQPRPARAARLHAARAEGGARRPPRPSGPTRLSTPRRSITELGVGEALVSVLEDKGVPSIVAAHADPPALGPLGPVTPPEQRQTLIQNPRRSPAVTTRRSTASPPTRCWQKRAEQTAVAEAERRRRKVVRGCFETIFGGGTARKGTLAPGQRVAREVTRTIVQPDRGQRRGFDRQGDRGFGRELGRPRRGARRAGELAKAVTDAPERMPACHMPIGACCNKGDDFVHTDRLTNRRFRCPSSNARSRRGRRP